MYSIPHEDGSEFSFELNDGSVIFILGPNGSGKSSLLDFLSKKYNGEFSRINAHRQNWLTSNRSTLSSHTSQQTMQYILQADSNEYARYRDDYASPRTEVLIHKLIASENYEARKFKDEFTATPENEKAKIIPSMTPIQKINSLLMDSGLNVKIRIDDSESLLAKKGNSPEFSLAALSDGERNAIFLGIDVFTSPSGTKFLIDEPERHLHPSISHSLLKSIFTHRQDCSFIISTHDIALPSGISSSKVMLIRGCSYTGNRPTSWNVDLIPDISELDDNVRLDVLGARKKILFVEGNDSSSLDKKLYSKIFPEYTVISKASCDDVESAVKGLTGAEKHHYVLPLGIIDNDNKPLKQIENLEKHRVYSLNVHSIESIYYHPKLIEAFAHTFSGTLFTKDVDELLIDLKDKLINILNAQRDHLCARAIEKAIRAEIFSELPTQKSISSGESVNIDINIKEKLELEKEFFDTYFRTKDLESLVSRYPIRETQYISDVNKEFGIKKDIYILNLLKLVESNSEINQTVQKLIGNAVAVA